MTSEESAARQLSRRRFHATLGTALACGIGCKPQASPSSAPSAPLSILLNWFPDAQHGGFYAADELGYFKALGLQVEIVPGGPGAPVVQSISLGRNPFAVGNADQLLEANAQGAPVVAVMAAMQNSPRCIMAHSDSGFQSLADIHDVKLALGAGKAFASYLQQKLPLNNVTVVPYTGSITPFLEDHKFAQQAYVFSEPFLARKHGAEPVTFMVSKLGFNPYTSCLFTHQDFIREHPELVGKVVQAVRQGWLAYFKHSDQVNARILQDNPQMDAESLHFGVQALQPLCIPTNGNEQEVGQMSAERWTQLHTQLVQLKRVPETQDPNNVFTTKFLSADLNSVTQHVPENLSVSTDP